MGLGQSSGGGRGRDDGGVLGCFVPPGSSLTVIVVGWLEALTIVPFCHRARHGGLWEGLGGGPRGGRLRLCLGEGKEGAVLEMGKQ